MVAGKNTLIMASALLACVGCKASEEPALAPEAEPVTVALALAEENPPVVVHDEAAAELSANSGEPAAAVDEPGFGALRSAATPERTPTPATPFSGGYLGA